MSAKAATSPGKVPALVDGHHPRRRRRAPQGFVLALRGNAAAREWLHEMLATEAPYREIAAELASRFGIVARIQTLSDYCRRHVLGIAARQPKALTLGAGQWLLTIQADGATHVEAQLSRIDDAQPTSQTEGARR